MGSKRWSIVAASSLALVASQGPINVFATGTFIKPISQELGFGRGDIATAIGISSVMTAVASPFFGRMIDRFGVRDATRHIHRPLRPCDGGIVAAAGLGVRALRDVRVDGAGGDRSNAGFLFESRYGLVRPSARFRSGHRAGRGWNGDSRHTDDLQHPDRNIRLARSLSRSGRRDHSVGIAACVGFCQRADQSRCWNSPSAIYRRAPCFPVFP